MKLYLIPFFFFFFTPASGSDYNDFNLEQNDCTDTLTSEPPFYVTSALGMKGKYWENFKTTNALKPTHYIPRGSIVYSPFVKVEKLNAINTQVIVLSVPAIVNENQLKNKSGFKKFFARQDLVGKKRAVVGQIAYINKKSIQSAGEFIFMLNNDSPVEISDKLIPPHHGIRVIKNPNGTFPVQKCCPTIKNSVDEKSCFYNYGYEIINEKLESLSLFSMNSTLCSLDLNPIPRDDFEAVSLVLKRYNKDGNINDLDPLQGDSEDKSLKGYDPDDSGRPYMIKHLPQIYQSHLARYGNEYDAYKSQSYMRPWTMCAFKKVVDAFSDLCDVREDPACKILIGDAYSHDSFNEHSSHDNGECFDLRPMRVQGDTDEKNGLKYFEKRYSQERTRVLIGLFEKIGGEVIFNDPTLNLPSVRTDSQLKIKPRIHNDHLHVCLYEKKKEIKSACQNNSTKDLNEEIMNLVK
jgi:hypothetical protein